MKEQWSFVMSQRAPISLPPSCSVCFVPLQPVEALVLAGRWKPSIFQSFFIFQFANFPNVGNLISKFLRLLFCNQSVERPVFCKSVEVSGEPIRGGDSTPVQGAKCRFNQRFYMEARTFIPYPALLQAVRLHKLQNYKRKQNTHLKSGFWKSRLLLMSCHVFWNSFPQGCVSSNGQGVSVRLGGAESEQVASYLALPPSNIIKLLKRGTGLFHCTGFAQVTSCSWLWSRWLNGHSGSSRKGRFCSCL